MIKKVIILRQLYDVREYLNGRQKGADTANEIRYNWNDLCREIGVSRQTVNSWLKKFTPAEHSDTGRDQYTGSRPPAGRVVKIARILASKEAVEKRRAG
jgi:hypothetical protein